MGFEEWARLTWDWMEEIMKVRTFINLLHGLFRRQQQLGSGRAGLDFLTVVSFHDHHLLLISLLRTTVTLAREKKGEKEKIKTKHDRPIN